MDSEATPKIRLVAKDKARFINTPVRLRLHMETPESFTWPDDYMLMILVIPQTAECDITPPMFRMDPTLGEEGAEELQFIATQPGGHKIRIDVMDYRTGHMLQVLEATIEVAETL